MLLDARVLMTSPYPEITELAGEIAQEIGLPVKVIDGALDEVVQIVQQYMADFGVEVLVSRGATADLLRQHFSSLPLIRIDPSEFDIIEALGKAKSERGVTGFLGSRFDEVHRRVGHIAALMGLDVVPYLYGNSAEFRLQFERARRDGVQVLIGGGQRGADMAAAAGIKHIRLLVGRATVKQALERAKEIAEASRREREKAEKFQAVVEYSHEGIIALDQSGAFTIFNPVAGKYFGLTAHMVLGKKMSELPFIKPLAELVESEAPLLGHLQETKKGFIVVNRVPLIANGEKQGLLITFQDVGKVQQLERKIRGELHQRRFQARYSFRDIIYQSSVMEHVLATARRFAATDSTVLIKGESGTGKELLAQGIHQAHPERREGPFVAINCAALTESLLESELFGYEEGSFTGAKKGGRAGLFELAHGGTIFLDEIGKLPFNLQGQLLRVLQEKEIRRVGGNQLIPVDVRVVAATNEDLRDLVRKGSFREDLYYRLNVLTLYLPPLRERSEDIPLLAENFLNKFNHKYAKKIKIPPAFMGSLTRLKWPGNVRQLENFIERLVLVADENNVEVVLREMLRQEFGNEEHGPTLELQPHMNLREMQREIVKKYLRSGKMTRTELAQKLGISRTTLWKLLKEEA
ncbi:MAG: hypothetical protein PWP65_453 [Clostridia bacterium]|nr:hypothetical protein [Clostridia bacterium]